MKKIIVIFILSIFILNFTACKKEMEVFDIGVIFPLTGATSYMLPLKNGLDMALAEIESEQLFGDRKVKLHYIDSESSIPSAIKAFDTLEKDVKPDLYISLTSTVSTALSHKAAEYKVPIICLITADPKVSEINRYTFSYYQTAIDEVDAIIPIIIDQNLSEIGIIYQDEEYGKSVLRQLELELDEYDIKIEGFPYSVSNPDISKYLEYISCSEALYLIGYKNNSLYLLKTLREIEYSGIIIGTSTFSTSDFLNIKESDGLYVAVPSIYNKNYTPIKKSKQQL